MRELELTPDPHLLESMRAVGYTIETAVADLIDNSIAAHAEVVQVLTSADGPARLSIFDDGQGMDRATALNAMRLAGRSPNEARVAGDLGRFGLGLKTASLSQCRRLTVATRCEGVTTILRWDLEHVASVGSWSVIEVSPADAERLLGWKMLEQAPNGTLVSWEDMDLFSMTEGSTQADFDAAMIRVRSHCELVFHRFATGDGCAKLEINFNSRQMDNLDPFLKTSRATQVRDDSIRVAGVSLPVRAFTLPYVNKMTAKQRRLALAPGSLRDSQGFYIYRGGRLVIWGTWFRLNPKSELSKLARVQVDVPNSLDHLWALDIKKSQAMPPREMRDRLRDLANQMITPSKRVQTFRGRPVRSRDPMTRVWDVISERDNEFRYTVNREHPLVRKFTDSLSPDQIDHLSVLLTAIEQSFPVVDAHNRLSQDGVSRQDQAELEVMLDRAVALRPIFADSHPMDADFVAMLSSMEPYGTVADFSDHLRQRLDAP